MLAASISSPVIAEMLKGISLAFISLRVAVTTISSRVADSSALAWFVYGRIELAKATASAILVLLNEVSEFILCS